MDPQEFQLRANSMIAELKKHINVLTDRCALLAADFDVMEARVKAAEAKLARRAKKAEKAAV